MSNQDGGVQPLRIDFTSQCTVGNDIQNQNVSDNEDIPHVSFTTVRPKKLAVVGGAPSAKDHLEELKKWDGDVWGINTTAVWLRDNGIGAKFFTVDPAHKIGWSLGEDEAKRLDGAIVASCLTKEFINALPGRVEKFHMSETKLPGSIMGGTTSAGRAPMLALLMGYREIHFFGCDSSTNDGHYAFNKPAHPEGELLVKAGDEVYRTTTGLYIQADEMSKMFHHHPDIFINRSEGLIKAMYENIDDWEVVGVSEELRENIVSHSGECVFDRPYEGQIP